MRSADMSRGSPGFSLIEMLVALAVFGMAVLGLLNLAGESTRTASIIEERAMAAVVADNRAVEAMIATRGELAAMTTQPHGEEVAGDREWRWTRTFTPTEDPGILRVHVVVSAKDGDRIAAELHLFRTAP